MPRLRLVGRDETSDPLIQFMYNRKFGTRDPAKEVCTTASGAPGNYEAVFAHSPDILEHAVQGFYVKQTKKRKLPLIYMELAITRIGWACGRDRSPDNRHRQAPHVLPAKNHPRFASL
jgi:hypothetical protein